MFERFKTLTVNDGINLVRTTKDAVLLDVRPREEYKRGHVAGSINIPMDKLEQVKNRVRSLDTAIYVVGTAEHKPGAAARKIKKMGYTNVRASGFMEDHHGLLKKG